MAYDHDPMVRSQDAITFLHELASGVVEQAENSKAHAQAIAKAWTWARGSGALGFCLG